MSIIVLFAPLLMLFEMWQLVMGERFLGVRQIERGGDPRQAGLGEVRAFIWSIGILISWSWMVVMLLQPFGRVQALCMLAVTAVGYTIRRNCRLKWVLVVLTFEGALRIGMLLSIASMAWRRM